MYTVRCMDGKEYPEHIRPVDDLSEEEIIERGLEESIPRHPANLILPPELDKKIELVDDEDGQE